MAVPKELRVRGHGRARRSSGEMGDCSDYHWVRYGQPRDTEALLIPSRSKTYIVPHVAWIGLPILGSETPALGNKGKVFCSFVEYHWDSARAWYRRGAKSAGFRSSL